MKALIKLTAFFSAIAFMFTGSFTVSANNFVKGDIDGDGTYTSADALAILRVSVGLVVLNEEKFAIADYNGDGFVDSSDALGVLICSVSGRVPVKEPEKKPDPEPPDQPQIPDPEPPDQPQIPDPIETPDTPDEPEPIDYRALEILDLCNAERAKEGVAPLVYDYSMMAAAQVRANEITEVFSHNRPNGEGWFTALTENGVKAHKTGENIAAGYASAEFIVSEWMNSEGHRKNILNPKYTRMCVAIVLVPNDLYGLYWEQLFASD